MMKYLLLLFLSFVAVNSSSDSPTLESELQEALSSASNEQESKLPELVLNHGEKLIPLLENKVKDQDDDLRFIAMYALVLIGGEKAKTILKPELERTQDIEEKAAVRGMICTLMGSTRTKADEDFLIESLQGPVLSDEGEVIGAAIEPAALTLGIMRSKKAIPALGKCSKEDTGGIAGHACAHALKCIKKHSIFSGSGVPDDKTDAMLLAVFKAGIPRIDESDIFYEQDRGHKWVFLSDEWKAFPVLFEGRKKDVPQISFDEHVSTDGRRAIIDVGLYFGPLNGKGYTYVLKHENGKWSVIQIISTWIS